MFGGTGLGTFPLASPFTHVSESDASEILDAYFEAGGVYVDTAPTYAFGAVEELLGRYFAGRPRDSFVVSTSCGYVREGDGYRVSGRPDDVRRDAEESLARLQLDYLDIYISHIPDTATPLEHTAAALQQLKDEGIAKRIGVSNVSADQLRRYKTAGDISVVQNRFSYVNRGSVTALLPELDGIDLVAYQVIERGLLSTAAVARREGDLRSRKPEFEEARVAWLREYLVSPLSDLAESLNTTVASLVVGWVTSHPKVALAQIGATRAEQAAQIPRFGREVDDSTVKHLETVFETATRALPSGAPASVEAFLGIADYDVRTGSASGR